MKLLRPLRAHESGGRAAGAAAAGSCCRVERPRYFSGQECQVAERESRTQEISWLALDPGCHWNSLLVESSGAEEDAGVQKLVTQILQLACS